MSQADLWEWWTDDEWSAGLATSTGPAPAVVTVAPNTPFPADPLDIAVEILIDGAWTDITSMVYSRDSIGITRGLPDEASTLTPQALALTLNNRDGRFAPRNPRGPYFGRIGRNTPIRVSVRPHRQVGPWPDITDTFTRTVGDTNWGISDTGKSWHAGGTQKSPNQLSVSSGSALARIASDGFTTGCYLDECAWVDIDLAVSFTVDAATGGSIIGCGIATHLDPAAGTTGPYVETLVTTAGAVRLAPFHYDNTTTGLTAVTVPGLVHTGQQLRVRVRTAGRTIQARAWDPAGAEPDTWHLVVEDDRSFDPGTVFLFAGALAGNTNAKFLDVRFDDLAVEAIEPRFAGEVANWPQRWTPGGQDAWTPIEAAGVTRRLSQGKAATRTSIARYVLAETTHPAVAYWTLEDGTLAATGKPTIGSANLDLFTLAGADKSVFFGQGTLAAWMPAVCAMNFGELLGAVSMPGFVASTGWAVDWMRAGSESANESTMIISTLHQQWQVRGKPASSQLDVVDPGATDHNVTAAALFDGAPHHIRIEAQQDGADINWALYLDGAILTSGVYATHTLEAVVSIDFQDLLAHTTPLAIGHVVVWPVAPNRGTGAVSTSPDIAATAVAAFGHDGEAAATRIVRLCAEEGIPVAVPGPTSQDLTASEALGPQRNATILQLILDAAESDGGMLCEARDMVGLRYRFRNSLYSQAPDLELDYTADGNLAPPLEPTDDDQQTVNLVAVTRRFGSTATSEAVTGPLSTAPPPDGVGLYDKQVEVDLATDARAQDLADWRVAVGTVDEARYPRIRLNLAWTGGHQLHALLQDMARIDVGGRVTVSDLPAWLPPADINQLVLGSSELLEQFRWDVVLNCAPASPYAIATLETPGEFDARLDSGDSTLAADATSSATSLSVNAPTDLWTTDPGQFPFDVGIGGVRITVTAISGAASPQTFTVLRSVDGFDIALTAGAAVSLWAPTRIGL